MRKLRQDIPFGDVMEFTESLRKTCNQSDLYYAIRELDRGKDVSYMDWPESFYERPPTESFGEFWRANWHSIWGHLLEYNSKNVNPYLCEDGIWYETFAPGLPTDVDADGMPK